MKRKKSFQDIKIVIFLLVAVVILFCWYTAQNSARMEQRNKSYAADAARQTMTRINEKMNNALALITTYAHFVGEGLDKPVIGDEL